MPVAPESVLLGWVHGGTVRAEFMQSVLKLTSDPAYALVGEIAGCDCGALVADGRNALAAQFLDGPLEWLWMVDSDVVFTPGTLTRLAGAADPPDQAVITGLCPVARGDGGPSIYDTSRDEHGDTTFTPISSWAEDDVIKVGACGGACLLIHRTVLEIVRARGGGQDCWFRQIASKSTSYGEDLSFCLRLAEVGIPLWAHTGATVGHVKAVTLGKALP